MAKNYGTKTSRTINQNDKSTSKLRAFTMAFREKEPDRCYICLASEDEPGPLSNVPENLISPCYCSLKAHQTCLVDWVMETGGNNIKEQPLANASAGGANSFKFNFASGIGINPKRLFTSENVRCAQCGHKITLMMEPSSLLAFNNFIRTNGAKIGNRLVTASLVSIVGGSVLTSLLNISIFSGLKLFRFIAPDSVLLNLLNVSGFYTSFESAVRDNKVPFNKQMALADFPIYLFCVRGTSEFSKLVTLLYPLSFINPFKLNPFKINYDDLKSPKMFLVHFEAIRRLYDAVFALSFNRLYYRWVHKIRPFHADDIPSEELEESQREITALEVLKDRRLLKLDASSKAKRTLFQRAYDWLFPQYSKEERALRKKQRARESRLIWKNDYTRPFFKGTGSTLLSTLLWPYFGRLIGDLLIKSTALRRLVNGYASTPDESSFIINCIGCLSVAVIKDLINLLIAYNKVKQFENIEILHREIEGFEDLHDKEVSENHEEEAEDEDLHIDLNAIVRMNAALRLVGAENIF